MVVAQLAAQTEFVGRALSPLNTPFGRGKEP